MLKHFSIIQGIGTFSRFRPQRTREIEFSKNTIIYANNGYGKSTIATILKSAYINDSQKILARATLTPSESSIAQDIVIKLENGTIIFRNGEWSYNPTTLKPEFLVFDQNYVYENLFVQKVEAGHKQSIHKIIIGREGIQLSEDLTNAKAEEKWLKQLLDEHKKILDSKIANTCRNDYLSIQDNEVQAVSSEIEKIEGKLAVSKEKDELVKLAKFPTFTKLEWDFSEATRILNTNIHTIHEEARGLVDAHISKHLKNNVSAESFLRQGVEQIIDVCPFCGQGLEGAQALMRVYQDLFDQTYNQAVIEISGLITKYSKWDPSTEILGLKSQYEQCRTNLKKLESHFPIRSSSQIPIFDFDEIRLQALEVKSKILDALSQKQQNLNLEMDLHFLEEFEKFILDISTQIDQANELYRQASQSIVEHLDAINAEATMVLENRKQQLYELRKRFLPEEKKWVEEYIQLEHDYQKAGSDCQNLNDKLTEYSRGIFEKYQEGVNKVLDTLGVDFRIEKLKEQVDNRAKRPYAEFQITINGLPVTLQDKEDCPCFQNTLSEGEKNTLSFAFFVTYLKQRNDLSNIIVVFDDPLSSMDDNRRDITARIIRDIAKDTQQMIVLTHKRDFLLLLSDHLQETKFLTLRKDTSSGSTILPFDVESQRKSPHQKVVEKLIRYVNEDFCDSQTIQGDIRLCLESALRFKYFNYLNGITTFGKMLDALQEKNKLNPDLIRRLRDMNNVSSPVHHGEQDEDPKRDMDRAEILPYVRKTLEILEEI